MSDHAGWCECPVLQFAAQVERMAKHAGRLRATVTFPADQPIGHAAGMRQRLVSCRCMALALIFHRG